MAAQTTRAALFLSLFAASLAAPRPWAGDPVLLELATRLEAFQVVTSAQDVSTLDALVSDGLAVLDASTYTFTDIDYLSENPAFWAASNHTARARAFATALISPASASFNSSSLRRTAVGVLGWWLAHRPVSVNWWFRQISIPGYLAPTALILWDELSPAAVANLSLIMDAVTTAGFTGANLVWLSTNVLWRGVLEGNRTAAGAAVGLAFTTLSIAEGAAEGIKADGSFFQHGAQVSSKPRGCPPLAAPLCPP